MSTYWKVFDMNYEKYGRLNQLLVYCSKQSGIYLLIIIGILVDSVIQFPFMIICAFENMFRKKAQ